MTVIVPVLDSIPELTRCVTALLAQDYQGDFAVIVADNGSATSPAEHLVADPRLRVLVERSPGSYAARNLALADATGEVIAFTDADCNPAPDWLTAAVRALQEKPQADMVGGAIDLEFTSGRPVSGPDWYEQLHGFPQEDYLRRGFAVTANLVTWRSVVDRVGPFDATLASGGDAEWGRRVHDAGGLLRYAPQARVGHPARATRDQLRRKGRRTTRGVATKALRRPGGRLAVLRMLAGHIRALAVVTVTVWFARLPPTPRDRAAYLRVRCAVGLALCVELVRCLAGRPAPEHG